MKLRRKEVLTEVYQAYQYNFENSNQMEKINRLSANGNYELESVWALKGDDADSIAKGDWETYDIASLTPMTHLRVIEFVEDTDYALVEGAGPANMRATGDM